jgi:hypothetical protein
MVKPRTSVRDAETSARRRQYLDALERILNDPPGGLARSVDAALERACRVEALVAAGNELARLVDAATRTNPFRERYAEGVRKWDDAVDLLRDLEDLGR